MNAPVLVFGAAGQVGRELMTTLPPDAAVGLTRDDVDITDAAAVDAAVARSRPRLVVNAAAYTAVDKAESEAAAATALNALAPGTMAAAAARHGAAILHLSTDYVFDGTKTGAYDEDDAIAPLGTYGRTKAEGEAAVRAANPRHVILRTAWVYGVHRANFLKTMLRLAAERDRLRVVADQHGCPTATRDIAEAIAAVDRTLSRRPTLSGTFHFAGTGATTWHGFAAAIVSAQADVTGKNPPVEAITTEDFPTPARRPKNSVLNSDRFASVFGYRAEDWRVRTREVVAALVTSDERPGAKEPS